jgi:lysophospholipase L1-like esterase
MLPQNSYSASLATESGPAVEHQSTISRFAAYLGRILGKPIMRGEITAERVKLVNKLSLVVIGDSMIQTMGENLPSLDLALNKYYPNVNFKLLNFGIGATDIESGLNRLPEILAQNPDIIVIESFAYNHWNNNQSDLNRHRQALTKIVETISNQGRAKIVLAAAIAPDQNTICDGIEGMNLTPDQKREKARTIKAYLQNLVNFAQSQNYPLADAYHSSLDKNDNGQPMYINTGDHLHPSEAGHALLSEKIAEVIFRYNLI